MRWLDSFADAICKVGAHICSDHHPILIDTNPERRVSRCRPFRFEADWLMHEQFKEFLSLN